MTGQRSAPAKLTNAGFQRIATNSTATTLNTTTRTGNVFLISTEAQGARLTFDGSTPTANTGVLIIAANSPVYLEGVEGTTIKLARAAAGCIVNIQAWRAS